MQDKNPYQNAQNVIKMATDKSLNVKVNENSEAKNKEMHLFLTDNFDKNREFRLEATVAKMPKYALKILIQAILSFRRRNLISLLA